MPNRNPTADGLRDGSEKPAATQERGLVTNSPDKSGKYYLCRKPQNVLSINSLPPKQEKRLRVDKLKHILSYFVPRK